MSQHFNNVGISSVADRSGGFNIWSNTFPAEQLPARGSVVDVVGVQFRFPAGGPQGDNIRCRGQAVALPPGRYDWIYLLGAAERRTEDALTLHYADGTARPQWLRLSDFWPQTPARFGEVLAYRCRSMGYPRHEQRTMAPAVWQQRVPVTVPGTLDGVTLPDNPAMHIFAMTLVADRAVRDAG